MYTKCTPYDSDCECLTDCANLFTHLVENREIELHFTQNVSNKSFQTNNNKQIVINFIFSYFYSTLSHDFIC